MNAADAGVRLPPGYAIAAFDEIDSTMDEARRRAAAGTAEPLWVWARRQTAGRGRRGRIWQSGAGNLLSTLLLRPDASAAECAKISFLTAVALAEALEPWCGGVPLALKWPNDVLLNGRKAAGILLESESAADGRLAWLAIGIGVNLAEHPSDAEKPATSLVAEHLTPPSPAALLESLADRMAFWLERWRTEGFAPIRSAWLQRAARIGEPIVVRTGAEHIEGIFTALDAEGRLVLDSVGGTRRISAGDVFFPERA